MNFALAPPFPETASLEGERTLVGAGMDCGHWGCDCSCHLRFSCASLCVCVQWCPRSAGSFVTT